MVSEGRTGDASLQGRDWSLSPCTEVVTHLGLAESEAGGKETTLAKFLLGKKSLWLVLANFSTPHTSLCLTRPHILFCPLLGGRRMNGCREITIAAGTSE